MDTMKHFVCTTDKHLTPPEMESRSLMPGLLARLPQAEAARRYEDERQTLLDVHDATMVGLRLMRRWDLHLDFGDLTGGWQEQGLFHDSPYALAEHAMRASWEIADDVAVAFGNHDTGYSDVHGGLSIKSVRACSRFSPLWWKRELEDVLFVGVCTPLLVGKDDTVDERIVEMRREQKAFLAETLSQKGARPWVLCTHDLKVGSLAWVIEPYMSSLMRCIYGDRHAPIVDPIMRFSGYLGTDVYAHCRRRSTLCPSVAPLGWRGGGALVGTIDGTRMTLERISVPMPAEVAARVEAFPYATMTGFVRAVWNSGANLR